VILAPILTEKTHNQQATDNTYAFKVHSEANKNDVKQAIEFLYKVTPLDVRMVSVVFKGRSQKKLVRKAYKKAIVSL
jgi:large subunit ribosomal protein L23